MTNDHSDRHGEWLTVKEAADMLPSVSTRTVQNWAAREKLEGAVKLPGGQWRIPLAAVEKLLGGTSS